MKNLIAKIKLFFVLLLAISCNSVKRVNDGELLLTKNTVYVNDEKVKNEDIQGLLFQKPNTGLRLYIYNLARENPDSVYRTRFNHKMADPSFLVKLLSKKQVAQIADYQISFHNWLKSRGEEPVIIERSQSDKSSRKLSLYYDSKGYFNNEVSYSIDSIEGKAKKGEVNYRVNLGEPYILDTISKNIASPALDSIYEISKRRSFISQDQQFNLANFEAEKERLNTIFLNSGIYRFQPSSISFDVLRDTLVAHQDFKMPVTLIINNPTEREGDSVMELNYRIHHIKKVNIYADFIFGDDRDSLDSISYKGYNIFYKDRLKYRPKALTDAVSIIPGDHYKDFERSLTYRQIGNLRTFKYPNIEYLYGSKADSTDARLTTNIYLTPRPKFSLGFDTDVSHSNIQDIGISLSTSIVNRNVFRGAETLEVSFRGTIGASSDASKVNDRFFNISETGSDVKLSFPRMWLPFNTERMIPKSMSPESLISIGTSFQKNIGLDKQNFNGVLRYSWSPTNFRKNAFELLNIQFIRNLNPEAFYRVYQNTYNDLNEIARSYNIDPDYFNENFNLIIPEGTDGFINDALNDQIAGLNPGSDDYRDIVRIDERENRLTSNNLIFSTNFTHTRNNRRGFNDNKFYQFRTKLELAGNLLSAFGGIVNFNKNDNDQSLVFGVPYSQYVKTEFDYIKYWQISRREVLAFRSFFGIAIPYGNSNNIPFIRSYFAGGSNDNRAWQAYSLGPGSSSSVNDFNEANMKISLNMEYRFPLAGDLKGAFFADAGNIWNVLDDITEEKRVFENLKSLEDIALGTGIGLRYDFSFFVFRFDVGFKTYNPAYESGRRWFTDYNFGHAVYNIGINYPF